MALAKALRCIGSLPESFFFCFLDRFCVCLLVSSVSRSHAYAVKVPATDRQTDRHTVRAAPGAVLASGPEAMWKARSGFFSTRTNLLPFTKDFRGGEHPRVYGILRSRSEEHTSELHSYPTRRSSELRPCGRHARVSFQLVQIFCLLLKISVEGNTPEFTVFLEALLRRSITCLSKVKFVPCSPLCSSG